MIYLIFGLKMIEILGIFAAIFELIGLYLIGNKIKYGFLINILANISWITYSFISKSAIGLIIVCSVAVILNIKGFRKWMKI
jgi:hypothetical protein